MKKMMFTLVAMLTIAVSANAMSYEQARNEALFLTDKMAYELNLSDAQYEAAYEINLDYLMGVTSYNDVFGTYWERRNLDLSYILYSWQWDLFRAATYFYRPLYWEGGYWHFGIYARYPHRDYFYFGRPHFYASYRGGHSWRVNGRSYYEGRHDFFRPNRPRDQHFGMRNGWDRGDYRGNYGRSSTRVTADHNRNDNRNGGFNDSRNGGFNDSRNGNFSGNRSGSRDMNNSRSNGTYRDTSRGTGSFQGNRSSNSSNSGSFQGNRSSNSSNSGSFQGNRSSNSGSFQGSRSSNSTPSGRSGGSFQGTRSSGGGSSMGSSSGSHSSSRSGSGHSGGSRR
ncbi:MAG: hypothetical protein IJ588_06880 [Prevotella sp.]|nr:hypothetical protein [Prevotella sp.]